MRVLHLQTGTGSSGGISVYISQLLRSQALAKFQHFVAVSDSTDENVLRQLYGGAQIVNVPRTYGITGLRSYIRHVRGIIAAYQIKLIHVHALRGALALALMRDSLGVPYLYTTHGLRFLQKKTKIGRAVFLRLERVSAGRAGCVVVIRGCDESDVVTHNICTHAKLIQTRISLSCSLKDEGSRGEVPKLLGVGSLITVKRPDLFIEWIAGIRELGVEVDAVWAGDGPLRGGLEREARSRNLPISFAGHMSNDALQELLKHTSLMLMPSDFEVFPISAIEAAAAAVPVVCRPFYGVRDVVQENITGLVLPNDDPQRAAQEIAGLLADPVRLQLLQSNAMRWYQTHMSDTEQMARQYKKVYDQLCSVQGG